MLVFSEVGFQSCQSAFVYLSSVVVLRDLKNCTNHLQIEVFHAVDQPSTTSSLDIFGSVISLPKQNCTIDGEVGVATCKGICLGRIDMENKVMRKQILKYFLMVNCSKDFEQFNSFPTKSVCQWQFYNRHYQKFWLVGTFQFKCIYLKYFSLTT